MSRNVSSAVDAALSGKHTTALLFIELDFDSGTLYLNNSGLDYTWNGQTWLGAGRVGSINPIEEGAALQVYSLTMTLSGIPNDLITIALTESYQGRAAKIWLAVLDDNHNVIDTCLAYAGRMDVMLIEMDQTSTITLTIESRLADWDRARILRYTDGDQRALYPGDTGLLYVAQMVQVELPWGNKTINTGSGYSLTNGSNTSGKNTIF